MQKRDQIYSNIADLAVAYTELLKEKIKDARDSKNYPYEVLQEIGDSIRILNHITGIIEKVERSEAGLNSYPITLGDNNS